MGPSLVVQRLRLLQMLGAQVQCLVRELKSPMPCGVAKKKKGKSLKTEKIKGKEDPS